MCGGVCVCVCVCWAGGGAWVGVEAVVYRGLNLVSSYDVPYTHTCIKVYKLTKASKKRIAQYEAKVDTVLW